MAPRAVGSRARIIQPGGLRLENLKITGGYEGGVDNGGTLTSIDCVLEGNHAVEGGALAVSGQAYTYVIRTSIRGNAGAGIRHRGFGLEIDRSTISGNTGWGIYSSGTSTTIENSTISGNLGGYRGSPGTTAVINSTTFASNIGLGHDTVADVAVEGDYNGNPTFAYIRNSILASLVPCYSSGFGGVQSRGNNVAGQLPCFILAVTDYPLYDDNNQTLRLSPLADNGGPTQTHALQPGSIGIDRGTCVRFRNIIGPAPPPEMIPSDQRGLIRPQDGDGNGSAECDIGAFEYAPAPPGTLLAAILNSYDAAIKSNWITGTDNGRTRKENEESFRALLQTAGDRLQAGDNGGACAPLAEAASRSDGYSASPDWILDFRVAGTTVNLNRQIVSAGAWLGCRW